MEFVAVARGEIDAKVVEGGTALLGRRAASPTASFQNVPADRRFLTPAILPAHRPQGAYGEGRPERLRWKASHPSTIRRFKAEVTCSHGHGIALRDHTVEADGSVVPSIVCKAPGCDFHEIVRLEGWRAGRIPAAI